MSRKVREYAKIDIITIQFLLMLKEQYIFFGYLMHFVLIIKLLKSDKEQYIFFGYLMHFVLMIKILKSDKNL